MFLNNWESSFLLLEMKLSIEDFKTGITIDIVGCDSDVNELLTTSKGSSNVTMFSIFTYNSSINISCFI